MRFKRMLGVAGAILFAASLMAGARAATINGMVKSPEGTPFEGAFVQAQNTKTRMTFMALSDAQGHYRIEQIVPGEYRVGIRAPGFRADAQTGVNLAETDSKPLDFSLQKGTVRWSDLSIDQARALLPPAEGKTVLFTRCFICHGFQSRMAAVQRDADGWKDRVQYMRDAMHFSLSWRLTDQNANDVANYLDSVFGSEATLTRSPADLPGYKDTVLKFTPDAYKINYVEYDMPGPSRMPFSASPSKDGYLWIPDFGVANKITRLDPKTGVMEDFPVPNVGTAAVHSAYEGPDGAVWLTEQASNKLGRWDPKTKTITEYQDPYEAGKEGTEPGGSKHTVRLDPHGNAWATGDPLSKFDPETGKYTNYWESGRTYSLTNDTEGNIWFTITSEPASLGKMDWKTLKMTKYPLPTKNGYPRRLQIDSKGVIWFGEYDTGKLGRFDMKTEKFKEYDLPTGPLTHPYGVGLDKDENIWYSSYYFDVLVKFDQKTEKFTQYPFPHPENTIRELFLDKDGKMWYGSPANNKVGYFYLTSAGNEGARGGQ
jgi:virginiamycin B lyase